MNEIFTMCCEVLSVKRHSNFHECSNFLGHIITKKDFAPTQMIIISFLSVSLSLHIYIRSSLMVALFVPGKVSCLEVSKASESELFFASFPSSKFASSSILIASLQNQSFYGGHLKAKNTVKWSGTQSMFSSSLFPLKSCCCCFGLISRWVSAKKSYLICSCSFILRK